MALTFAHPAAVLPLARRWLVPSALVVGSMAPDLAYYLRLPLPRSFTHSLLGLLLFALPAGLAALWVFHVALKRPLLELMPERARVRLAPFAGPFAFLPPLRLGWIAASLLAGALTHLLWDSFTDPSSWLVMHVPVMRVPLFPHPPYRQWMEVHRVIHYVTTGLGLAIIAVWGRRWLARTPPGNDVAPPWLTPGGRYGLLTGMLTLAFIAGVVIAIRTVVWPRTSQGVFNMAAMATIGFVDVLCIELGGVAVVRYAVQRAGGAREATGTHADSAERGGELHRPSWRAGTRPNPSLEPSPDKSDAFCR